MCRHSLTGADAASQIPCPVFNKSLNQEVTGGDTPSWTVCPQPLCGIPVYNVSGLTCSDQQHRRDVHAGGSIRQPAHFCGIVGLKPTYGRVSRYGLIAYGSSLDCVGPLAGCVEDVALILQAIAGRLRYTAFSIASPNPTNMDHITLHSFLGTPTSYPQYQHTVHACRKGPARCHVITHACA